jgi:predicted phage baseplate assembly protein
MYRVGNGLRGNVAADSITSFDVSGVGAITNPLAASGGLDPESAADVKQLAPQAWRAVTYRAVRPEDYAEAAERLPWVQRAGASFRWTGSWLSAFVTPDPLGAPSLSDAERQDLSAQLDRFRQAGREAFVLDPEYAAIDLDIGVCVARGAYRGEVKAAIREALLGRRGARPRKGFFDPDNFTFGTPLERASLEAAIQSVPGVRAVEDIQVRRRGYFDWRSFDELSLSPGPNEVIQLQDDPLHPARGSLRLRMLGGA